jgi:hypothetical protein
LNEIITITLLKNTILKDIEEKAPFFLKNDKA